MHTFKGDKVNIFYNGDYSGEIEIVNKDSRERLKIDFEEILEFVSEYVRNKKIEEIENMDYKDILKFK